MLSAAYPMLPAPDSFAPKDVDIRDCIVFAPNVTEHSPVIRDDVAGTAAAIAELRNSDPAADLSALCIPGWNLLNEDGEIKVIVRFEANQQDILSDFTAAGFRAGTFHQSTGGASGWVSYADLDALAEVTGVKEISFATPPIANDDPVVSDGDGILRAEDLRDFLGVDGSGITVGVISNGVYGWQSVKADGELPASFDTSHIDPYRSGYFDKAEGTAMLEIVHDLAPGATLFFSGPADSEEMLYSIDWLVAQGCDIIVDDLSFFNQPFFDDGDVANAALDAIANDDVVYVSAAGNFADRHYQADFNGGQEGTHQFAEGEDKLPFLLGPYAVFGGYLQWGDEWGHSGHDYNLHLYQGYLDNGDIVWFEDPIYSETTVQNGDDDPVETIELYNDSGYYFILGWQIEEVNGSGQEVELYTVSYQGIAEQLDYYVAQDSIFGQAAAEGVIAVGAISAIDQYDPNHENIEPFSSQGPSTVYTFPLGQNPVRTERNSLDVAGIDGVSTKAGIDEFFDSEPFYGTSAAAPHIAAIAALLKQINPSLTPAEVVDLIGDNAYDLRTTGYDGVFGHGRADALAIISAATDAPDLDDDSDTGVHDNDDITNLDNSENGKELIFNVGGTTAGATVKIYYGDELLGQATATGSTTAVTTDGDYDLADGLRTITATQTIEGKLESAHSTGLVITVDTEAPTVQSFTRLYYGGGWDLHPTTLGSITIGFSEEVYDSSVTMGDAMALYNLSTSQAYAPVSQFDGQETDSLTWTINTAPTAGWYRVTISGTYLKDIAGNAMGSDYVYGTTEMDMLIPILGDANLDGAVGWADLSILTAHMGQSGNWTDGDFDYNGWVDTWDYMTLKQHNGQSVSR